MTAGAFDDTQYRHVTIPSANCNPFLKGGISVLLRTKDFQISLATELITVQTLRQNNAFSRSMRKCVLVSMFSTFKVIISAGLKLA